MKPLVIPKPNALLKEKNQFTQQLKSTMHPKLSKYLNCTLEIKTTNVYTKSKPQCIHKGKINVEN